MVLWILLAVVHLYVVGGYCFVLACLFPRLTYKFSLIGDGDFPVGIVVGGSGGNRGLLV